MSFNGSGTFSIINTFVPGTTILSSAVNQNYTDIASGLSNAMCKDGQQISGANQPMGNFRLTNLHAGSARSDSANIANLQDGLISWAVAGSAGTANAIIATYSPAHTALADGDVFFLRAIASTTSTTPTFNPDGLGANTITRAGGSALIAGDIPGNLAEVILRYNSANTRYELLNPFQATALPATTIDGLTLKSSPATADEVAGWDKTGSVASKFAISGILAAATAPTVQRFTSGSAATYTPTAGFARIRVRMCGGGGGGAAAATNSGSNGNATLFGSWTANGGTGAAQGGTFSGGAGGTGGTNSTGTLIVRLNGGNGSSPSAHASTATGGGGGVNPFGGSSGQIIAGGATVQPGQPNTGAGGSGGVSGGSANPGGGAGEYVEFWMTAAQVGASQTYTVGTGGNGGAAGTVAGGNGAAGIIIIEEFYI